MSLSVCEAFRPGKLTQYITPPSLSDEKRLLLGEISFKPEINSRRIDLIEMATILYGKSGGNCFATLLFLSLFPLLIGYTSVFASSLAAIVPLFGDTCNIYKENGFSDPCRYAYMLYGVAFLVSMIILVIVGLVE